MTSLQSSMARSIDRRARVALPPYVKLKLSLSFAALPRLDQMMVESSRRLSSASQYERATGLAADDLRLARCDRNIVNSFVNRKACYISDTLWGRGPKTGHSSPFNRKQCDKLGKIGSTGLVPLGLRCR